MSKQEVRHVNDSNFFAPVCRREQMFLLFLCLLEVHRDVHVKEYKFHPSYSATLLKQLYVQLA